MNFFHSLHFLNWIFSCVILQKIDKIHNFLLLRTNVLDQTASNSWKLSPLICSMKLVWTQWKTARCYKPPYFHQSEKQLKRLFFFFLKSRFYRKWWKLTCLHIEFCEESVFLAMNFVKSPFFFQWIFVKSLFF